MIDLVCIENNKFSLKGTLLVGGEKYLLESLKELVISCKGGDLIVDLKDLETVNSIVLAVLLSGAREAHKHGCHIQYINFSDYLFNMARVGGLETVLFAS